MDRCHSCSLRPLISRLAPGRAVVDREMVHVHDWRQSSKRISRTSKRDSKFPGLGPFLPRRCCEKAFPSGRFRSVAGGAAFYGKADCAAQNLRRPGRDRHRERAVVSGTQGIAGTTDRDERDPGRHRQLADRYSAGAWMWSPKMQPRLCEADRRGDFRVDGDRFGGR